MKNVKLLICGLVIIVVAIAILLFLVLRKSNNQSTNKIDKTSYYLMKKTNIEFEDYKLFKNSNELKKYFDIDENELSLKKYNYLGIAISYDSCSERNIIPNDYYVKNDTLYINFTYEASCGVCAPDYLYYVLALDKELKFENVKVNYKQTNKTNCPTDVAYKPIIYLYPTVKTDISVKLKNDSFLITTYPKYKDSWYVTAYPSGKLISENREYYGLYWEGINYNSKMTDEGFVVAGSDTISFLEEKLRILGLNDREADEFIIYWLPKLEQNKYNYIRFASIDEINSYMPLEVYPKPDSVIRIMMEYKPLDKEINVTEQKLYTPNREGFVLVEWGGSLIK